jgi:hypothetical protein
MLDIRFTVTVSGCCVQILILLNNSPKAMCRWLMPIILATQRVEIKKITVQSQARQRVCETLSPKKEKNYTKGVGPEFKPQ